VHLALKVHSSVCSTLVRCVPPLRTTCSVEVFNLTEDEDYLLVGEFKEAWGGDYIRVGVLFCSLSIYLSHLILHLSVCLSVCLSVPLTVCLTLHHSLTIHVLVLSINTFCTAVHLSTDRLVHLCLLFIFCLLFISICLLFISCSTTVHLLCLPFLIIYAGLSAIHLYVFKCSLGGICS